MPKPDPIDTQPTEGNVLQSQISGPTPASELGHIDYTVNNAPYAALSNVAGQLGDFATKALEPQMEDQGAQAVTRDPGTGQLTVQTRLPLNDLDAAYNHGAESAFAAQSETDRRQALRQMAIDNIDDPAQFQNEATAYVKQQAGGAGVPPGLRTDILTSGLQDVGQFSGNLVTQKQARDTRNQLTTINGAIEDTKNDIFALAHDGGVNTPDFSNAVAKLKNQYGTLRNPIFGVTQDDLDHRFSDTISQANAEATVGQAVSAAKANGATAGMTFLDKAIWSPDLNLSPAQRSAYQQRGNREIGEWTAQQRDAATQLKQVVQERLDDAKSSADNTGDWQKVVSPDEIYSAFKDDPAKASDIVSDLNGRAATFSMRKQVALASPQALQGMAASLNPATPGAPGSTVPGWDGFYSGFLAPHEGGFTAADGNGHPANFGINQGANPDVDVANLSQADAKQILHDRYWTASGADKLPPALAAVQGDTAVNMGVGAANDLLGQSGGDVNKYLDLRAQRYKGIAANDPTKAGSLPGWLARNEDLRNYVTGGAFADQQRTYKAFITAVQDRNKALVSDPSGYVNGARPDISTLLQSQDPGTFQLGVRQNLQAQRDLGVNAPRLLTNAQTQGIVQQFNNPPGDKPADTMNAMIDKLSDQYGSYFPQAMRELSAKGLPPEAAALNQARGNPVAAVRLSTAINSMSQMGKNLTEGRDAFFSNAPNSGEIKKAIPGAMGDYAATFAGNPQGPPQVAAMTNAVNLYAHQLSYEGVNDPQKAASMAYNDLVGSRYNMVDTYRVPKGIDPALIQAGAGAIKDNLPAANLEPYAQAAPGVSDNERRTMSATILSKQGRWVTAADDSGLALVWPAQSGFKPAVDARGKPIAFSWPQLEAAARNPNTISAQQAKVQAEYLHTGGH